MGVTSPKKRAAIYIRVSTQEQSEMYGEDLQMTQIKKLLDLKSADLELAGDEYIYIDSAVSGADNIENRPALSKLFEDLQYSGNKPFDTVVVYKIDRLARKLSILLNIIDRLQIYNVGFISTQESFDTDTAFGKAMLNILGVFAELERDTILERTSSGYQEAQNDGIWMQNKYGYRRDNKKLPIVQLDESKVIKKIFERYVNDWITISEIIKELEKYKFPMPAVALGCGETGKGRKIKGNIYKWGDSTIRKILMDNDYIGIHYYNKTQKIVVNKASNKTKQINLPKDKRKLSLHKHTPIIDEETFQKAQKRLAKKGDYKNSKENYILSGFLKCDHCKEQTSRGMTQWKGTTSNGHTYYQCNGKNGKHRDRKCEVIPLPKKALEDFIVNNIKILIQNPELIGKFINNSNYNINKKDRLEYQKEALIKKREKIIEKETRLNELYLNDEISREVYNIKKPAILKELGELPAINQELIKTEKEIHSQVEEGKYKKGFELLNELIGQNLDKIFNSEELTKKLFNYIIEEIVIYSRPKNSKDAISGPKTGNQYVPNHIEIVFRLPQEFFDEMLKQDMSGKGGTPFPDFDFYDWSFYGKNTENGKSNNISDKKVSNSQLAEFIYDPPTSNFLLRPIKKMYRNGMLKWLHGENQLYVKNNLGNMNKK